ncbi:bifunctional transcriptional activator/DNA repair enzyme Ada [Drosophila montana]|uniref:bifunctional transcriptional activator/DNA repair enzyme Ada n=1 Tax=Drosophila montana TaxID=40370 RepID=UPI00313AA5E6
MWISESLRVSLTPLQKVPVNIKYGFMGTKFGRILLGLTPIEKAGKTYDAICLLYFVQKDDSKSLEEVRRRWPKVELVPDEVAIQKRSKGLFNENVNTAVIDVAVLGTDLQLAVWGELVKMKAGSTCTYTELAVLAGRPKAVRAVASAVAKNEISILIPCHRIVSKSGAVKYGWGADLKSVLLEHEANTP